MPAAKSLKLGQNVNGYTWIGGDPNDKNSWVNPDELASTGLTGQPFLDALGKQHPSLVPKIKAISEGRQAFPNGKANADPYWQTVMTLAQQFDPTLDQVDYPTRQKTAASFRGDGTAAQNMRNLNQGIGHLNAMMDAAPGVAGHSGLLGMAHLLNQGINAYKQGSGDPGITAYEAPRTALASELAAIFKGKGASSEAEVNKFYNLLDVSNSTAQKQSAARALVDLLNSRLEELGQQYSQGMGTTKKGIQLLNPQAQEQFKRLMSIGLDPKAAEAAAAGDDSGPADQDPHTQLLMKKYGVPH